MLSDGSMEAFEASDADSWEEARKEVEKGVYDRTLELAKENEQRRIAMEKALKDLPPIGGTHVTQAQIGPKIPPTGGPVNAPNTLNNTKPSTPAGK